MTLGIFRGAATVAVLHFGIVFPQVSRVLFGPLLRDHFSPFANVLIPSPKPTMAPIPAPIKAITPFSAAADLKAATLQLVGYDDTTSKAIRAPKRMPPTIEPITFPITCSYAVAAFALFSTC